MWTPTNPFDISVTVPINLRKPGDVPSATMGNQFGNGKFTFPLDYKNPTQLMARVKEQVWPRVRGRRDCSRRQAMPSEPGIRVLRSGCTTADQLH